MLYMTETGIDQFKHTMKWNEVSASILQMETEIHQQKLVISCKFEGFETQLKMSTACICTLT